MSASFDSDVVGTPLYEEVQEFGAKGPATFQPTKQVDKIWNQEVVDAEGKRRFHGAFTGGFSAGYFNSVGSKEGWAPSEFKSSRSKRHTDSDRPRPKQAAEDFMDEDDLVSFGGKQLETNSDYDFLGGTAAELEKQKKALERNSRSVIPGMVPGELVVATNDPIGKRLLKMMGWREGQGIGPRKKRAKRRKPGGQSSQAGTTRSGSAATDQPEAKLASAAPASAPAARVYGCPLPPGRTTAAAAAAAAAAA
eukprot:SAG22_NODE_5135_length_1079_cov_2.055102_1_plen_250_part_10